MADQKTELQPQPDVHIAVGPEAVDYVLLENRVEELERVVETLRRRLDLQTRRFR